MSGKVFRTAFGVLLLSLYGFTSRAQEKPDAPTPRPEAKAPDDPPPLTPTYVVKRTSTELFLGFKPNLQPLEVPDNAPPLTPRQKYAFAFHEAEDFKAHLGNVLQAAVSHGLDEQPHYGQGWGAYAQRYGAAEGDQVTSCFFIYGLLPHVFKTDPRYFRKKHGSIWSRTKYAALQTIVTRKDSGGTTFNTPQVLGQLIQRGISNTYYPQQDRGLEPFAHSYGLSLVLNSGYNIAAEFYPDIWHKVFRRK